MLGLDYSSGRPSGAAVKAARYDFVARYLPNGLMGSRVNLSAAEVADMRRAGVAVVMVWESQANRAAGGRAAAIADATMAAAQAKVVGLDGLPIYFAVDFDLPDYAPAATSPRAKLGVVGDYFDGVASVLPHNRIGVYGGYWAVRRVLDAGLAAWGWQTVAWSGGNVDPRIHLYQRAGYVTVDGVQCDVNEARQDQFGQHPQGDDMLDPTDPIVQQLLAGAGSVQFGQEGVRSAGDLALAVDTIRTDVDALKAQAGAAIDLDALAAKVAARIHLTGQVVVDGQPTS